MPRKSTRKKGAVNGQTAMITDAPYNPRRIDDNALAGLKASMATFRSIEN